MIENQTNHTFLNLKLIDFSDSDKTNFESIFSLAEARFKAQWRIVTTEEENNFYLFSSQPKDVTNQTLSLPASRCLFYVKQDSEKNNELLVSENNLPSMRSLITLFNQLSENLSVLVEEEPKQTIKTPPPVWQQIKVDEPEQQKSVDTYNPDTNFSKFLLSSETLIYHFEITGNINSRLYVDLTQKVYYSHSTLEQLKPFFSNSAEFLSPRRISEDELKNKMTDEQLKPQPLNNLIWYVTICCSLGRLLTEIDSKSIIHLKRWPDITLPDCQQFIKLAAYMHNNSANFETIHQETQFSLEQIYNFYNACHLIGLIKQTGVVELSEKNTEKSQLLSKISQRLKKIIH